MNVSAQISLYPLRQAHLSPAIDEVLEELRRCGAEVQPGVMSTLIIGDSEQVFLALQQAFHKASQRGQVVMVVTLSRTNIWPTKARLDPALGSCITALSLFLI